MKQAHENTRQKPTKNALYYFCPICREPYKTEQEAIACREQHYADPDTIVAAENVPLCLFGPGGDFVKAWPPSE